MSDLIYRQKAIEALKENRALYCDNTPESFRCLPYGEKCRVDEIDACIAELVSLPSAEPELCEDAVSRQRLLSDLKELIVAWKKYPVMAEQIKGVETAIGYVKVIPSVKPYSKELSSTHKALDTISRRAAIVQLSHNKTGDDDCDVVIQNDIETIKALPSEEVSADIIHLQKEQAYMQGYEDGKKSRKGKWILTQDEHYEYCTCSECGYQNGENWMIGVNIPFCAMCGSYNGGGEEGDAT